MFSRGTDWSKEPLVEWLVCCDKRQDFFVNFCILHRADSLSEKLTSDRVVCIIIIIIIIIIFFFFFFLGGGGGYPRAFRLNLNFERFFLECCFRRICSQYLTLRRGENEV